MRATYDADANQVTLTLTNANITHKSVAINTNSTIPLVIELVGENHISVTAGSRECIYYTNNLTIQGSGTLELNSAGGSAIANSMRGSGPSDLVISGVSSLTASGLYQGINIVGGVRIENSAVSVSCTGSYNAALKAMQDIEISGSMVSVTASGGSTYGIQSQGGSISISDSDVEVNSTRNALMSYNDLTIADSRVRATATANLGIWTQGNLSVSGDVDIVSNGIAMADGCTFTVTPAEGSLLEVKAGTSQTDAKHIANSPFAEQTTLSRLNDAYCSIKPHQHVGGTATCVAAAICSDCGQSYGTPDAANHAALTAVTEKTATCTETGNIAYWYCADCGKYFRDEACTEEIAQANTVLAVTPHNAVKTEEKPATCTETGNIAYWHCTECGKYFSDEACTQEITLENTVLSEKGHQYQDGVCTVCGAKDPNVQPPETGDEGESQTPGQSAKPETTPERPAGSGPKTGDDTLVGMWVFLLLAGIAGLTGTVYYRKKKQ